MKTTSAKNASTVRAWHLLDCQGATLGRLASQIAGLVMGKHKHSFTPNLDLGDYCVVINAKAIHVTGNKLLAKTYSRHSNYPGGYREITLGKQMEKDARKVIEFAVRGMLPKNKLQSPRLRRLKIYLDSTHPHANNFTHKEKLS